MSPVKRSVEGLEELIQGIEKEQFTERILLLLPRQWHKEILYFLEDEFQSKVVLDGDIVLCSSETISQKYHSDEFNSLDGEVVRVSDQLAAYIEASMSITYGIKAPILMSGKCKIYEKFDGTQICGINFKTYFDYFEED